MKFTKILQALLMLWATESVMAQQSNDLNEKVTIIKEFCGCYYSPTNMTEDSKVNIQKCYSEVTKYKTDNKISNLLDSRKSILRQSRKSDSSICSKRQMKKWKKRYRYSDYLKIKDEPDEDEENTSVANNSEIPQELMALMEVPPTKSVVISLSDDKTFEPQEVSNREFKKSAKDILDKDWPACKDTFKKLKKVSPEPADAVDWMTKNGCPRISEVMNQETLDEAVATIYGEVFGEVLNLTNSPLVESKVVTIENENGASLALSPEEREKCIKGYKSALVKKIPEERLVEYLKNDHQCIIPEEGENTGGEAARSVASNSNEPFVEQVLTIEDDSSGGGGSGGEADVKKFADNLERYCACHIQHKISLSETEYENLMFACLDESLAEKSDHEKKYTAKLKTGTDLQTTIMCSKRDNRRGKREFKRDLKEFEEDMKRKHCSELAYKLPSEQKSCFKTRMDYLLTSGDLEEDMASCNSEEYYPKKSDQELCKDYSRFDFMDVKTPYELDLMICGTKVDPEKSACIKLAEDNKKNFGDKLVCPTLTPEQSLAIDWASRDNWFKKIDNDLKNKVLTSENDPRKAIKKDCQCRNFQSSRNINECELWVKRYGDEFGESCVAEKKIPDEFVKEILSSTKLTYQTDGSAIKGEVIDQIGEDYFNEMKKQDADYKKAVRATNDIADETLKNEAISKIVVPKDYRIMFNAENRCQCQIFTSVKSRKACSDYITENGDANLKYVTECSDSPNKAQCWALAAGRETLRALGTVLSQRDDALGAIAAVGMNFGSCVPRDFMSQVKCIPKTDELKKCDTIENAAQKLKCKLEIYGNDQACASIKTKKCQGVNDTNLIACMTSNTITGMNMNAFGREIKECPGIPDGANKIRCKQRINDECLKLADQEKLVCANNIIASTKAIQEGKLYNETKGFADGMGAQISGEDNVAAYNANGIDSANGYKDARKMESGLCLAGALTNSVKDLCIRTTKEGSPQRKNCDFAANVLDAGMHVADCLRESPVPNTHSRETLKTVEFKTKMVTESVSELSPRQLCFIKNGAQSASKLLLGDGESTKCFSIKDEKERNKCLARAAVTAGGEFTDCFNLQNPDPEVQKQMRQRCMLRKGGQAVLAQIPTDTPQGKAIHTAVNIGTALGSCGAFNKGAFQDTTKSQNMDMAMCMTQSMLPFVTDIFASDEKCNKIEDDEARGKCLAKNESIRQIAQVANTAIQVAQYAKQCENAQDKRACYLQGLASFIPGEAGVYLKYMASGYTAMKMKCDSLPLEVQKAGALVGTGGDLFTHIYQKVKVKKLKGIYSSRNVKGGEHSGETLGVKFASNDPLDALRFAEDSKWLEHDLLKKQILFQNIQLTLTAAGTTLAAFEAAIPTKHMKPTICKDAEPKKTSVDFDDFLYDAEKEESLFAHLNKKNEIEIYEPNLKNAFYAMATAKDDIDALIISKDFEFTMSSSRKYSMTLDEYKQYRHDYLAATIAEYDLIPAKEVAKNTINIIEVVLPSAFAQDATTTQQPADGKKKNPNFWQTTDLVASMAGEGLMGNITGVAAMTPLGHCHSIVHKIIDKAYEKGVKKEFAGKATLKVASKAAASLLLRQMGTETKAKIQSSKLGAVVVGVSTGLNLKKQLDENKKRLVNSEAAAKETSNKRVEYEEIQKKALASGGEVILGEGGHFEVSTKAKEDAENVQSTEDRSPSSGDTN